MQRDLSAQKTSYTDLLAETRLELAAELLADPRIEISRIATIAGFAHHCGFTRAFRQWLGMAPRQYRATHAQAVNNRDFQPFNGRLTTC